MEHLLPAAMRDEAGQALPDFFMPRSAASGEPWRTFLGSAEAARMVASCGMVVLEDVGRRDQVDASLWQRSDALRPHQLGRVIRAAARA